MEATLKKRKEIKINHNHIETRVRSLLGKRKQSGCILLIAFICLCANVTITNLGEQDR